jgi:hypothetical protein
MPMLTRVLQHRLPPPNPVPVPLAPRQPQTDPAYAALPRLMLLRDTLLRALPQRRSPWNEPPVFFFDRRRQTELESSRSEPVNPLIAEFAAHITAELPVLCATVEVRRVARTIPGLQATATALASACPEAQQLAELLAVPDDEVFVVLDPLARTGYRVVVQGVADVGQFSTLLADLLPGELVAERFVRAYRDVNPVLPAGVPMVVAARFQLSFPAALRSDGTLPSGFAGCEHWLWPSMPLATIPRIKGERVVLLGKPAFPLNWDVDRRFPTMPADLQLLEELNTERVREYLTRLTGHPILPRENSLPMPARQAA